MSSGTEDSLLTPEETTWWESEVVAPLGRSPVALPPLHNAPSGMPLEFERGVPALPPVTQERIKALRLKRAFDLLVSVGALVALLPLAVCIGLAIMLTDPGPIFFRQERVGLAGKPFRIFKFRTMRLAEGDDSGVRQTVEGDPRVTPLGNFLRRKSLDELPQLLNVVRGEMSLVGPRPHVAGQLAARRPYAEVVPYYDRRHAMPPGLTGWAQVNGYRGPTDTVERAKGRVDHDLAYIQNFTLLLDLKIILKTVHRELTRGSGF